MADQHAESVRRPMIPCEGSGHPPSRPGWPLCAMCGCVVDLDEHCLCEPHDRLDILALFDGRGDA